MAIPGGNYVTLRVMPDELNETIEGDGYAVSNLAALGEGPGFRKIRAPLGVTAFGINAIVLPESYAAPRHAHERQEETYFVHSGTIEIEFGDGTKHRLGPGGLARVDASTVRRLRNVGSGEATFVCVGGENGYVGRDGKFDGQEDTGGFGK
jgi:mannose-6-phosphate isomerase-like protein (cupin superfamily)